MLHQRLLLEQVLIALLGQRQLMLQVLGMQRGREGRGIGSGRRRSRHNGAGVWHWWLGRTRLNYGYGTT